MELSTTQNIPALSEELSSVLTLETQVIKFISNKHIEQLINCSAAKNNVLSIKNTSINGKMYQLSESLAHFARCGLA
jgi:hypothetical protein